MIIISKGNNEVLCIRKQSKSLKDYNKKCVFYILYGTYIFINQNNRSTSSKYNIATFSK